MNNGFYCGKGKVLSHAVVMDGAGPVLGAPRSTGSSKCAATFLRQLCATTTDSNPGGDIFAKLDAASAKLDRIAELTRDVVTARKAAPSLAEMASSPGPSAGQIAAQWRAAYEARAARACAESEAAYAARNPHKKARHE